MARGRMIDRELYANVEVGLTSIHARYLYIGSIVQADDSGRLRGDPIYLKAKIFPFDAKVDVAMVKEWRDELTGQGLIQVYEVDGKSYIQHPHWQKWQIIRRDRLQPSDCPPIPRRNDNQVATKCQPDDNQRLTNDGLIEVNRSEVNRREPKTSYALTRRENFCKPSAQEVTAYGESIAYRLDGQGFCDFYDSKGWKIGTTPMKDWRAAVRTWKRKSDGGTDAPNGGKSFVDYAAIARAKRAAAGVRDESSAGALSPRRGTSGDVQAQADGGSAGKHRNARPDVA